jgi:hypothetical protein
MKFTDIPKKQVETAFETAYRVFGGCRLNYSFDNEGDHYPLIDALTPENQTVDVGEKEIKMLLDTWLPDVLEAFTDAEEKVGETEFDEAVVQAIDKIVCYKATSGVWDVRQIAGLFSKLFKAAIELYSTREEVESIQNIDGYDIDMTNILIVGPERKGEYWVTVKGAHDNWKFTDKDMSRDEFIKLWKASKNT